MKKLFFILTCFFSLTSIYAREYVDPNKRNKKSLLEDESQNSLNESSKEVTEEKAELSTFEKNRQTYCSCFNLYQVYDHKLKILSKLYDDKILDWENYSQKRENSNEEKNDAKAAFKKAL